MTSINRNISPPSPELKSADSRSRLENLYKTLEELRKQLRSLHKRLEEAGNVDERMAVRHQISAVEEMAEAVKQQIMAITQLEKRKHETNLKTSEFAVSRATPTSGTAVRGTAEIYKPPYDLSSPS